MVVVGMRAGAMVRRCLRPANPGLGLGLGAAVLFLPGGAGSPAQVAAGAGIAAAAILALLLPAHWLLYGVIVAIPFDNFAVPVGPLSISLSDALLVIVTLRWLLRALYRGGRIARSELYVPAALFFVLLLPSFFATFDLRVSLRQAFSILMMLLTAIIAANLLRTDRRAVNSVTWILSASAIISLLALVQLFIWARYHVAVFQREPDVVHLGDLNMLRLTATYFDPNYFALYLIVPIVLGLFAAVEGQASPRYRSFAWLIVALDLAVFLMTFSRGAWVTLLVFMAAFVLLRARAPSRGVWLAMLIGVLIATPVVAALLVGINPASIWRRLTLLQLGMEVMAGRPLTGTGLGTFMYLPQNELHRLAHSTYIQVGADAGIPALVAFMALMIVLGFNAITALRGARPGMARTVLLGCLFALGCIAAQSAFLNALVLKHVWLLAGLTSAAAAVARSEAGVEGAASALQAGQASPAPG
jgi:O-antigen ligase